jgi:hypothetical protein
MSFGYQRQKRIYTDNTAVLEAFIYAKDDETLIPQSDISQVEFTVLAPTDDPDFPSVDAEPGDVTEDGKGEFAVPAAVNSAAGHYLAKAVFTYTEDGHTVVSSVPIDYDVIDIFERNIVPTAADNSVDAAWQRFEDLFDSEIGGPWLRDQTLARFDKDKIRIFLSDTMFDINAYPPQTAYSAEDFPYDMNDGGALVTQGLVVHTIRHLMRSYAEQPDVINSAAGFLDRKRYMEAWTSIYQVELERYKMMIDWYKRFEFNKVGSKVLVGQKAGRMIPGSWRTRNVIRGF